MAYRRGFRRSGRRSFSRRRRGFVGRRRSSRRRRRSFSRSYSVPRGGIRL